MFRKDRANKNDKGRQLNIGAIPNFQREAFVDLQSGDYFMKVDTRFKNDFLVAVDDDDASGEWPRDVEGKDAERILSLRAPQDCTRALCRAADKRTGRPHVSKYRLSVGSVGIFVSLCTAVGRL